MKKRELINMGVPRDAIATALQCVHAAREADLSRAQIAGCLERLLADPASFRKHDHFAPLARQLSPDPADPAFEPRPDGPAEWTSYGHALDPESISQMRRACELPVSLAGALMPDCHVGYGLPIGGVLATDNAVIPYAVGVDIACRMRLTILDLPPETLIAEQDRLTRAIEEETRFGIGASFKRPRAHEVLERDWSVASVTKRLREKACAQLGTSGSGNHFVEFGVLELAQDDLGLPAGEYLALLSHSGSRGPGASVADHYSKLAMSLHPELPKQLKALAWLDLDSAEGQEYWAAMSLMGEFAAANHQIIHESIVRNLRAKALSHVENHHNFAWKETHVLPDGSQREVVVHRKGATPAGAGVLGIVPGSMASPAFVVRGKGEAKSLRSAAHGAGRVMSRRKAKESFRWAHVRPELETAGVTLLSAGLDEVPGVYKDIHTVMAQQRDLVETVATFHPRLVKMAPPGERAED